MVWCWELAQAEDVGGGELTLASRSESGHLKIKMVRKNKFMGYVTYVHHCTRHARSHHGAIVVSVHRPHAMEYPGGCRGERTSQTRLALGGAEENVRERRCARDVTGAPTST